MTPDLNKAAAAAAETLLNYGIKTAPVDPLYILEQIENLIVVSFAEMSNSSGISQSDLIPVFGAGCDAVTSFHTKNGKQMYVVAYNNLLPFNVIQRALARELGHIVLHHTESSRENTIEAECFMYHLICPRPLIHAIQATGIRFTADLLANMTGVFEQSMINIRHIPGTSVPVCKNRFLRTQFMPFILNFFNFYQNMKQNDGSAIADLGTFMDGYEE